MMKKPKLKKLIEAEFTPGQRKLVKKSGTPADFALAVYAACPNEISMDEAETAIQKYRREFNAA